MKTISHLAAVKAVVIASCALISSLTCYAQGNGNGNGNSNNTTLIPSVPGGWLTAFPTVVQTGTKPTLTWSITYPSTVTNYVTITQPGTITTTDQLDVDIKVIGSGVTTGGCAASNVNWVPAQAMVSVNGGTFISIFYGTNPQVNPNLLVWSKRVNKNTVFRFGGRYFQNGAWSTTYTSSGGTNNIRVLKNGEYPPTAYPLNTSTHVKSFMQPYLDGGGRIKIGPLDVIVMMELTQSDANINSPCYNLQDIVLLMTCKPKGNNGHGNNIDGVDVSNPGNGHGGPNGQVDPSGTVDDERR
ncbi:MAG: hypothetical protein H7Y36_08020 [Armatimonadetes bacterium]|nr:hypothetical protein [Akkermansiaceae bacterium]